MYLFRVTLCRLTSVWPPTGVAFRLELEGIITPRYIICVCGLEAYGRMWNSTCRKCKSTTNSPSCPNRSSWPSARLARRFAPSLACQSESAIISITALTCFQFLFSFPYLFRFYFLQIKIYFCVLLMCAVYFYSRFSDRAARAHAEGFRSPAKGSQRRRMIHLFEFCICACILFTF